MGTDPALGRPAATRSWRATPVRSRRDRRVIVYTAVPRSLGSLLVIATARAADASSRSTSRRSARSSRRWWAPRSSRVAFLPCRLAHRGLPLVPPRRPRLDPDHAGLPLLRLAARGAGRACLRSRRLRRPSIRHPPREGAAAGVCRVEPGAGVGETRPSARRDAFNRLGRSDRSRLGPRARAAWRAAAQGRRAGPG